MNWLPDPAHWDGVERDGMHLNGCHGECGPFPEGDRLTPRCWTVEQWADALTFIALKNQERLP